MESVIYKQNSANSAERLASGVYNVLEVGTDGKLKVSNGSGAAIVNKVDFDERLKSGRIKLNCLTVQCIEKQRDKHNNIKAYLLQDKNGNKKVFDPKELKQAIANYQIQVTNLTLTSDNRLVDTAPPKQATEPAMKKEELKQVTKKVKEVDYILDKDILNRVIETLSDIGYKNIMINGKSKSDKLIAFAQNNKHCVDSIPKTKLSYVNKDGNAIVFCEKPQYNLKMPVSCKEMCYLDILGIRTLSLNGIDWSDTESTEKMFSSTSGISNISIMNSEAPKLKNMYAMFKGCKVENVDLSTFKVPNLDRTTSMFQECSNIDNVNLSGLNFSKVRFVGMMFYIKPDYFGDYTDVSDLIEQCKKLGWKGYADGRPDDFDAPFSKPIKHYEDEKPKKKRRRVKLRPLNKYANKAIADIFH